LTEAPAAHVISGPSAQANAACRACGATGLSLVVDLGPQPPAERFVDAVDLALPDVRLPLRILACPVCLLVQLEGDPVPPDDEPGGLAFSVSPTMQEHIRDYVGDAVGRSGWHPGLTVIEVASHGNRLHEAFRSAGARSTLIESVPHFAQAARDAGVPTIEDRLTPALADRLVAEGHAADLFVDAFYLSHDPRPAEYLAGVERLLTAGGVAAFEFDHLLPIVLERQYDGFRHGHASYVSLLAFTRMLARAGLRATHAVATPVYGGSVRVFTRRDDGSAVDDGSVDRILSEEEAAGVTGLAVFETFARRVEEARAGLRTFFDDRRRDGKLVAGYGAPSRGNTLLNSSRADVADVAFVVDRAPSKQGRYLPGSRIPILAPTALDERMPDYLLILTWDLRDEIVGQMSHVRDWGCRFVVPLPSVTILD
jgi:hypothetical protein